jgi:hypothetical protein
MSPLGGSPLGFVSNYQPSLPPVILRATATRDESEGGKGLLTQSMIIIQEGHDDDGSLVQRFSLGGVVGASTKRREGVVRQEQKRETRSR